MVSTTYLLPSVGSKSLRSCQGNNNSIGVYSRLSDEGIVYFGQHSRNQLNKLMTQQSYLNFIAISSYSTSTSIELGFINKIISNYIDCININIQGEDEERTTISILLLTQILYFPINVNTILSEEIIDWVNKIDPSPSTQEGLQLISFDPPWLSLDFWTYLHRFSQILSTLFLIKLTSSHLPTLDQYYALD
jgi:hypothetical protein